MILLPPQAPSLPVALRHPMRQGYLQAYGDGRQIDEAERGSWIVGPKQSRTADEIELTLDLSRAELAIFERFFIDETRRGVFPFLMPDPITDGWGLLDEEFSSLLDEDDLPLIDTEIRMYSFGRRLPNRSIVGVRFRIAIGLRELPL